MMFSNKRSFFFLFTKPETKPDGPYFLLGKGVCVSLFMYLQKLLVLFYDGNLENFTAVWLLNVGFLSFLLALNISVCNKRRALEVDLTLVVMVSHYSNCCLLSYFLLYTDYLYFLYEILTLFLCNIMRKIESVFHTIFFFNWILKVYVIILDRRVMNLYGL